MHIYTRTQYEAGVKGVTSRKKLPIVIFGFAGIIRLMLCVTVYDYKTRTETRKLTSNLLRRNIIIFSNEKYVPSNSESVQCNFFFIFDHVTFIQFKIYCCVQNFMKIR